MIIDHITVAVSDFGQSKAFFQRALAPLDIEVALEFPDSVGFGKAGKPEFWVARGKEVQRPMHIAFAAQNRAQVQAFYAAALTAGGKDNGPPAIRANYHPNYYAAFVIAPDGHNVEAVCHTAQ